MGTRATFHFRDHEGRTTAIIYRGMDGYPEEAGVDLLGFLDDVKSHAPNDPRFGHPQVLAARYVVWLSQTIFAKVSDFATYFAADEPPKEERPWTLDFHWMGIVDRDPTDIEYRYVIDCPEPGPPGCAHEPEVHAYSVKLDWETEKEVECVEVRIPRATT